MRWPAVIALVAVSGCLLEIVQGTSESQGHTATSSTSGGLAATSTGTAANGATAAGGSTGGNGATGGAGGGNTSATATAGAVNGATGGVTATGGNTGGNGATGGAGGGNTTGATPTCDAGLTYCVDVSTTMGTSEGCTDTTTDSLNCGTCDNDCTTSYANGSSCSFGLCSCDEPKQVLCVELPTTSPPACDCLLAMHRCSTPSFATDVYPFLAQQTGAFGCSASGCHSGAAPAANLAFLDSNDHEDAGMAYAELTGTGGGNAFDAGPFCDAGVPAGAPSECACVSRVVPGNIYASYLIDTLANDLPGQCSGNSPMPPPVGNQDWQPLPPCSLQVVEQWVATGAAK